MSITELNVETKYEPQAAFLNELFQNVWYEYKYLDYTASSWILLLSIKSIVKSQLSSKINTFLKFLCKIAVSSLLMYWGYCSLTLKLIVA